MTQAILYIHGQGGNPQEAEQYRAIFPDLDLIGVEYPQQYPWDALPVIQAAYEEARRTHSQIWLLANSIGAYFGMLALQDRPIEKALLISPVLDMERLILDMMSWAGVSEAELQARGEIATSFGQTLSWKYLVYVREHPIQWNVPTEILYGEKDELISCQTVDRFVASHPCTELTMMQGGEHWFHTESQLAFLNRWLAKAVSHALDIFQKRAD